MKNQIKIISNKLLERPLIVSAAVIYGLLLCTFYSGFTVSAVLHFVLTVCSLLLLYLSKDGKWSFFILILALSFVLSLHMHSVAASSEKSLYVDGTVFVQSKEYRLSGRSTSYVRLENGSLAVIYDIGENSVYGGEYIKVKGRISEPDGARNPGEFDYRDYLLKRGVKYILNADCISHADEPGGLFYLLDLAKRGITGIRTDILELMTSSMDERYKGLFAAVCLGDTSLLGNDIKDAFQLTSCPHLIAVSGTHFAGFLAVVPYLTGFDRRKTGGRMMILFFCFAVSFLTGFGESVTRACVMCCCQVFLRDRLSGMSLAALIMMIADPFTSLSSGFNMSMAACLGIIIFAQKISELMEKASAPRAVISVVSASLAAHMGLLPFFGTSGMRISFTNYLCQIAGGVLVSAICLFLLPSLILCFLFTGVFSCPLEVLLRCLYELVSFCSTHGDVSVSCGYIGKWVFTGIYIALVFIVMPDCVLRKKGLLPALMTAAISCGIILYKIICPPALTVIFADVGQGDSCIIMSGGKTVIIDGGMEENSDSLRSILNWYGADKVDLAFVTHWDDDHYGGISSLYSDGRIAQVVSPTECSLDPSDPCYISGVTISIQNSVYMIDDDVKITVIAPDKASVSSNDNSLVLLVEGCGEKMLFTGDIGFATEQTLLSHGLLDDFDVLKVAHHGSRTSTGNDFLDKVRPEIAVISCGRYNSYGHPAPETVERLESHGCVIRRTDEEGAIVFEIN